MQQMLDAMIYAIPYLMSGLWMTLLVSGISTVGIVALGLLVGLVAGWPVNMDGSLGPRTQSTRTFASNLKKQISLPILLWDERMTTMAVERMMIEADMSRKRRAELVDKLAASYILQGVLDRMRL